MVLKFAHLFGILMVASTVVQAQDLRSTELFERTAQNNPKFAFAAAYALDQAAPIVATAGPISKNNPKPVANDARWHIGSISKSFTATLVLRLVDQGRLDLEAPIGSYLEPFQNEMHLTWRSLTLRQLLSHTSGLPANAPLRTMMRSYDDDPYAGRRRVLSSMWESPLKRGPGQYKYSNVGYVLAGLIIEETLNTSWEEAILSEIAAPLGLKSLGFGAPTEMDAPRGHLGILGFKKPVEPENPKSDNPRWLGPAGTIHLSLAELVKWGQTHLQACAGDLPSFLSQASCQLMHKPVSDDYGLGWIKQTHKTIGTEIWHNGSNTRWYARLSVFPDRKLVIAAATNAFAPQRVDRFTQELATHLPPQGQ